MASGNKGSLRTRLPVAAAIAFAIAGTTRAVDGSPMPPGFSVFANSTISINGASCLARVISAK